MSDLSSVLSKVRKAFRPRKSVDFEEEGLHIELENLTSIEEIKVLEAIKDLDGAEYLEALKRHTLAYAIKKIDDVDMSGENVPIVNTEGQLEAKSKYLYMRDYLMDWPAAVLDLLFDAYSNIQAEVDAKLQKDMKFERFALSEKPSVKAPPKPNDLRQVREREEAPADAAEALNRQVSKEIEQANAGMQQAETNAVLKLNANDKR